MRKSLECWMQTEDVIERELKIRCARSRELGERKEHLIWMIFDVCSLK